MARIRPNTGSQAYKIVSRLVARTLPVFVSGALLMTQTAQGANSIPGIEESPIGTMTAPPPSPALTASDLSYVVDSFTGRLTVRIPFEIPRNRSKGQPIFELALTEGANDLATGFTHSVPCIGADPRKGSPAAVESSQWSYSLFMGNAELPMVDALAPKSDMPAEYRLEQDDHTRFKKTASGWIRMRLDGITEEYEPVLKDGRGRAVHWCLHTLGDHRGLNNVFYSWDTAGTTKRLMEIRYLDLVTGSYGARVRFEYSDAAVPMWSYRLGALTVADKRIDRIVVLDRFNREAASLQTNYSPAYDDKPIGFSMTHHSLDGGPSVHEKFDVEYTQAPRPIETPKQLAWAGAGELPHSIGRSFTGKIMNWGPTVWGCDKLYYTNRLDCASEYDARAYFGSCMLSDVKTVPIINTCNEMSENTKSAAADRVIMGHFNADPFIDILDAAACGENNASKRHMQLRRGAARWNV